MILHTNTADIKPMKVIDMSTKTSAKAYLTRSVEDTHTPAELEAVMRAINYTKIMKQEESLAKMNEEEIMERPLPGHGTFGK